LSRPSGIPLRIEPRFSRSLAWFVTLIHLISLSVVLALPFGWVKGGLLVLLLMLSFAYCYLATVLKNGADSLIAVELDAAGEWTLITRNRLISHARLHHSSFVKPWLTILTFKTGRWMTRSLILPADSLDTQTLRRLRVRIRSEVTD
jgi:hypothetical protein